MPGLFVLYLEVIAPRPAECTLSKITARCSPLQINHFELALDDPVDDEPESNDWFLDGVDVWKSWI